MEIKKSKFHKMKQFFYIWKTNLGIEFLVKENSIKLKTDFPYIIGDVDEKGNVKLSTRFYTGFYKIFKNDYVLEDFIKMSETELNQFYDSLFTPNYIYQIEKNNKSFKIIKENHLTTKCFVSFDGKEVETSKRHNKFEIDFESSKDYMICLRTTKKTAFIDCENGAILGTGECSSFIGKSGFYYMFESYPTSFFVMKSDEPYSKTNLISPHHLLNDMAKNGHNLMEWQEKTKHGNVLTKFGNTIIGYKNGECQYKKIDFIINKGKMLSKNLNTISFDNFQYEYNSNDISINPILNRIEYSIECDLITKIKNSNFNCYKN